MPNEIPALALATIPGLTSCVRAFETYVEEESDLNMDPMTWSNRIPGTYRDETISPTLNIVHNSLADSGMGMTDIVTRAGAASSIFTRRGASSSILPEIKQSSSILPPIKGASHDKDLSFAFTIYC